MSNPFDYINNINSKSPNMMRDSENDVLAEKGYEPFLTNRSMSYHYDTVMIANIVNSWMHVDKRPQYEFYKSAVKPKKRFGKWQKPETSEVINIIIEQFKCNKKIAEQYLSLMNEEQINQLKKNNNKGG